MKGHLSFPIAGLVSVVPTLLTFNHQGSRLGKEEKRSWKLQGNRRERGQGEYSKKQTRETRPGERFGNHRAGM